MIENSSAGLVMVAGEVTVVVPVQEHHLPALARHEAAGGERRQVAVELGWRTSRGGRHRDERAIEVRLDDRRVGELTHAMSRRYAPIVERVGARGGRPGCAATIERDARGTRIALRLPRSAEGAITLPALVAASAPPAPARRGVRLAWVGAGVAVAAAVLVVLGTAGDPPAPTSAAPPAATAASEPVPPATTGVTATTTTPAVREVAAATSEATTSLRASATTRPARTASSRTERRNRCDPNYGGCVPVARDVDCAGAGRGPVFVTGPVEVIGTDVYHLDRNHNGVGCDE